MRPAFRLPFILCVLILLTVAVVGIHRHLIVLSIQETVHELEATTIDFTCKDVPTPEALQLLLQTLAAKNPYFYDVTFQLDCKYPWRLYPSERSPLSPLTTVDLKDVSGDYAIHRVKGNGLDHGYRPRRVIFGLSGKGAPALPYRTWSERMADAAVDEFRRATYPLKSLLRL